MNRVSFAAIALTFLGCATQRAATKEPAPNADEASRVTAIADAYVAEFVKRFPEQAAFSGIVVERHDGLTDNSLAALREWEVLEDAWAQELSGIDSARLFGRPEWVTLGFVREAVESSRQQRVCRYELWPVNQLSGWPSTTSQLAAIQPIGTETARKEALDRWRKVPRYLSNELDNLRQGLAAGYSTPRPNVQLVIGQLDQMLQTPVEKWPLYSPAERDGSEPFAKQWTELLNQQIKPAVEQYNTFLKNEYLPKAREAIAITAHPNGAACYQAAFRSYTTIDRPARETFELGSKVVKENLEAALAIGKEHLQASDLPSLLERLNKDPANHFASREELLAFARAAVARASGQLGQSFARLPKAQITVEPYPDFLERGASDSYWPAAQDGSRPAMYRITLYSFAETTRSNAEITAFHEAYPGHHLQLAIAGERGSAHVITRLIGNSGFAEGWARYAEALAEEDGLYSTKYALANRRLWPARGLVVDPGLHLFGWTREQVIQFAAESGRFDKETTEALVDRVAMWPAQLTAYDTGAQEFFALRKLAEERLGARFDRREFHNALLENGTVTLPMLREQVMRWIESKAAP